MQYNINYNHLTSLIVFKQSLPGKYALCPSLSQFIHTTPSDCRCEMSVLLPLPMPPVKPITYLAPVMPFSLPVSIETASCCGSR